MRFEDYWENYGELHASMCGGNIKQFAKEIWMSAKAGNVCCPECKRELKPAPSEGWEKKECFLIFEDHEPVKLVDSMQKFYKHDSHGKTKTWLIFDLE